MSGASGTIFDWAYFAPERPAFDVIATWSDSALTIALLIIALLVALAAFNFSTLEKAVLFAWLILP